MQETVKQSLVGTSGCLNCRMMLCGVDACIRTKLLCVGYVGLSIRLLFRYEGSVRLGHDKSVSQVRWHYML